MRTWKSPLIASIGCAALTSACATFNPTSAPPPRIAPPPLAVEPCRLPVLPAGPVTWADLERVYLERGEAIVDCDLKRRLALGALDEQHEGTERWVRESAD